MRSNNPNATHFLLRRNFFIGVVIFLVVFFTLPMWGLSHIPESKSDILMYYTPKDVTQSLTDLVSIRGIQNISLEVRCLLYGGLGFLTAIMLFRHLFSRKQGMLHASLPDKREKDFLRRLIGYGVLGLGPIVLNFLLYLLIVLANGLIGYVNWSYLLAHMGMMLLVNLYGFAVGVLASVLTGTWWAAILAGAVLLIGMEGLFYVWTILTGKYLHTYVNTESLKLLEKLSPTFTLYKSMYRPDEANLLPGLISVLVSLGAAFCLYRTRKTESTEKTLAFDWLHTVMGFILPLMGGSVMGIILMYSFASESGLVLGLILGALLTYWVCRMVFNQRFCGILKQWYLPVAAACALVLCVGALHTDVMGYDHYLPERSEVKAISYEPIGYRDSDEIITLSSPETLDAAYGWCEMMRGEVDTMENGLYEANMAVTDSGVLVIYHLEGRNVTRRYPNGIIRNDAQSCFETIIESDDYRESLIACYHLEDDNVEYVYVNAANYYVGRDEFYAMFGSLPDRSLGIHENPAQLKELLAALKMDILDRSFADKKKAEIFTLDISWADPENDEGGYVTVPIFAGDENVLGVLFGDKAQAVIEFCTGGFVADEDYVVLQVTHSASRREMTEGDIYSFDMVSAVKEASTPEEKVEWVKAAQRTNQHRRYFMPDYEDRSFSNLYIYSLEDMEMYRNAGDTFEIPEDRTQFAYDRTIPISFTMHCIGK